MSRTVWLDRALIYGPYVGLCICEADFVNSCRRLKIAANKIPEWITEGKDATVHSMYSPSGDMCCMLCIQADNVEKMDVYALLVHEAVHIWRNFMEEIREENPSSEFEAYAIQSLSLKLFEAYDKLTKKKVKK